MSRLKGVLVVGATLLALALVGGTVYAAVGQSRTAGPNYDRNPSVVQDGALTYLFFTRTKVPCNRLAACNPDTQQYDVYHKVSSDGGRTFGPAVRINLDAPAPLFGRTVASARIASGPNAGIYVFWASGGTLSQLFYFYKPSANASFPPQAPTPIAGASQVFNVEAIGLDANLYVYTEEQVGPNYGIHARQFSGPVAAPPMLVAANRNIPKAIIDNRGIFRMTMVDASAYPTVNVHVKSSADPLIWPPAEQLVASRTGVSNWDPALAQKPNGRYYLFFAPDKEEGAGRQEVALKTSGDFVRWSPPDPDQWREITPGFQGGTEYWDYWPEPFVIGNKLILFYTSERGAEDPAGIGHIWTVPGQDGGDFDD